MNTRENEGLLEKALKASRPPAKQDAVKGGFLRKASEANLSPDGKKISECLASGYEAAMLLFDFQDFFTQLKENATEEDTTDIYTGLAANLEQALGKQALFRTSGSWLFSAIVFTRQPLCVPLYSHIMITLLEKNLIIDLSSLKVLFEGTSKSFEILYAFFTKDR